ncbi:MAG: FAD-dependent 5-carboxymethylaminomethyl-2-thiouridine(34) oxidoreductase MnmC [Ideonella sp.]|nr:FAD-dependent 5-carboxymethylaminomethyl-2-thiouridine(34) oxidoreductase MnmC [Ideonella sp.]MCC7457025.1 FAD-dependent 5-carboxymethylaminomethyl-2-thiouridine(34) oxidoreductase MnmC [Nitrospira sp.]
MTAPLQPARIDFADAAAPRAIDYDDIYHARGGAFEQARHVFLAGNGLPQRWAGRQHFAVLETGFGLGQNFLATWAAWRDDPARCAHLWFLSVDKHPPLPADLQRAHAHSAEPALARELVAAWPPLTPDLHRREFADGRVHLLLAFGDVAHWLPQWVAQIDAFYLDGFAPAKNPAMWQPQLLRRLARLAAPGASAATWSTARVVRDALAAAAFEVQVEPGFDRKREMLRARHAPQHSAPPPVGRRWSAARAPVAIVGAGLAGASAARALAALGVASRVFDTHAEVAAGGSGQSAGLLHGVVHAHDSPHTRWFRAGALRAHSVLAPLIAAGAVRGSLAGLLRLERGLDAGAMQRVLDRQGLPADYLQVLTREAACTRAGCEVTAAAWWYAGGGWVSPRSVVRTWLDHPLVEHTLGTTIERLRRDDSGRWLLLDANGRTLAHAEHVVLANADGFARLIAADTDAASDAEWSLLRSRGQITWLQQAPRDWHPSVPVAGDGYAIALGDGLLCGATSDLGDDDPALRDADHRRNLDALQRLSGRAWPLPTPSPSGRVAWRVHARDRLPLIGGVPSATHERRGWSRQDQPRFIPRVAGLYLLAAFGSRGLTQAALAGEVLAALLTDTPLPIGSALLDAVDAARFAARAVRR